LFGGTYAGATNISIHGTCQITHGLNRFSEDVIYSEQIMSPFRNPNEKSKDSTMTTLGTQSKLEEGHYVHHFSVNPKNIEEDVIRVNAEGLTTTDIAKLKEGLRKGASYYDSTAKSGTENELLFWLELKEGSNLVMPSFIDFVNVENDGTIDLIKVKEYLAEPQIANEIEKIEIFYNKAVTKVVNVPENSVFETI
jgi:CRISPR-associated protein Csh2